MGDPKAFLNIPRQEAGYRPIHERITDFSQVEQTLNSHDRKLQASRCMDCGVPFCHWACPLGNKDPEFQDALYRGKWREAYQILNSTNDFPEFTGRICPALCEKSCVLKLSCNEPVTIRENEAAIAEAAFREGYITPLQPERNGKKVAVIGGGDTGSDCIGTSIRQGAVSVTQIEIMPQPPIGHNPDTPWPQWPVVLKTTSSHEEGCTRRWSLASTRFIGKNGKVCGVEVEEVEWLPATDGNRPTMKSTGKKEVIEADMVLLAMGFLKPEQPKFAENVFVAGDAAHGASLVVRALADGRRVATEIDRYLEPLKENKK